jgi:hypothetical protein
MRQIQIKKLFTTDKVKIFAFNLYEELHTEEVFIH